MLHLLLSLEKIICQVPNKQAGNQGMQTILNTTRNSHDSQTRGRIITANAFLTKEPHEKETRPRYNDLPLQASVVNSPTNWKDLGRGLGYPIYKFARANHGNHNHL